MRIDQIQVIFLFQLYEKPPASVQSEWNQKSEIEIRFVLADCACGRPKLALEKKTIESKENISDSVVQPNDSRNQAVSVNESNGKTHLKANLDSDSDPLNVIEISEGQKNDEYDLNICQLCGNNWRQFTSVLPGLLLLLTLGAHNVFTIYELDHFNLFGGADPLLTATKNFNTNGISRFSYDSSPPPYHNNYNSFRYNNSRHNDYSTRGYEYGSHSDDTANRSPKGDLKSFLVIVMWFVGAIVGNVCGAVFLRSLKKRTIYVSFS